MTPETEALLFELKWVMYLVIWRKRGTPYSYQTISHYLKVGRAMARYCLERSMSVVDILGNKDHLIGFAVAEKTMTLSKDLAGLLSLLAKLGEMETGYRIPGEGVHQRLLKMRREYSSELAQHPPLPTRIYSTVIATLSKETAEFEAIKYQYLKAIDRVLDDPLAGVSEGRQFVIAKLAGTKRNPDALTFEQLIDEYGIRDYMENRRLHKSIRGLSNGLHGLQLALRLTVQLYTGMRAEEAAALMVGCLKEEKRGKLTHYVVQGVTTKLNHGQQKAAKWVTSSEAARAIRLAEHLALYIAKTGGVQSADAIELPLFISVGYLPLLGDRLRPQSPRLVAPKLDLDKALWLRSRIQPAIAEEDIRELEQIDPHRAWRSEKQFRIGQPWALTSHQLRRSLALYAQRSGLVSLPSLRRQLQHITEEMSRYYARGSQFAKNFIGPDKKHFGYEWQEAHPVSSALSYILNVLISDDVLFGGHSNWVDHRFRRGNDHILVDREATIERFKKGELAYRETLLGGCTNTDECDQVALRWLDVNCVSGCKNLVGRLPKLDRVIAAQSHLLSKLDPGSIQYRTEKADLDVLIDARERIQKKQMSSKELG
jgi:integrase